VAEDAVLIGEVFIVAAAALVALAFGLRWLADILERSKRYGAPRARADGGSGHTKQSRS
jgi:hypothetical protein